MLAIKINIQFVITIFFAWLAARYQHVRYLSSVSLVATTTNPALLFWPYYSIAYQRSTTVCRYQCQCPLKYEAPVVPAGEYRCVTYSWYNLRV